MEDCIFCKIIQREMPATVEYEDDLLIAFRDINPVAPVHVLVVPKEHVRSIYDADEQHRELLGQMLLKANEIAQKLGISESGFRFVLNNGPDAGQLIDHLHLHILGGERLGAVG